MVGVGNLRCRCNFCALRFTVGCDPCPVWAVFAAFTVCAVVSVTACVIFAVGSHVASGLAILSAGIVCCGLSIMMFCGCKQATKGVSQLTRKIAIRIKNCFIKKEEA